MKTCDMLKLKNVGHPRLAASVKSRAIPLYHVHHLHPTHNRDKILCSRDSVLFKHSALHFPASSLLSPLIGWQLPIQLRQIL